MEFSFCEVFCCVFARYVYKDIYIVDIGNQQTKKKDIYMFFVEIIKSVYWALQNAVDGVHSYV